VAHQPQNQQYPDFKSLDQAVGTMKIIASALIAGALVFAVIATLKRPAEPDVSLLTYVLFAIVAGKAGAFAVVPAIITKQAIDGLNSSETSEN